MTGTTPVARGRPRGVAQRVQAGAVQPGGGMPVVDVFADQFVTGGGDVFAQQRPYRPTLPGLFKYSDLEDVLQQVWVTRAWYCQPRRTHIRPRDPMSREQARALAIDLSRRSTPAEGGLCTFQPVLDGGACPWNLDCHNCGNFVLSGADLLYWRRKREQW